MTPNVMHGTNKKKMVEQVENEHTVPDQMLLYSFDLLDFSTENQ